MTTLEDVLCDGFSDSHTRRFWSYYDTYECPPVTPITLGDNEDYNGNQPKRFIKIGISCPVCFEGVYTKTDAFLTPCCSHAFHASCLVAFYNHCDNPNLVYSCPLCRQCVGEPHDDKIRYLNSKSLLDKLEDFWMCYDRRLLVHSVFERRSFPFS